ncbi:hypothetical protein CFN78_27635 [Amycolatopsis antarctica]|uniref:Uncharacterized protein n=1 Tax=Amycolatopsis antarctica TaxID=1854586 RepID=A0A263CVG5_9PSEU|nr:hypothetical protein [Amycolatopsis antarctica]OZM69978.1 hypothetical protein CFN78_27635 [Amycolatopsis antarctica]
MSTPAEPGTSVRYFGGPLDGRVQRIGDTELVRGAVIRHVHLHDGPKIETRYELAYCPDNGWQYRLCGLADPENA